MTGLAGDCGIYCPYDWLLFADDLTRTYLARNHETFLLAQRSRETHRIAARQVVLRDPWCMAFCMGVANTDLLPPFLPVGRAEDTVFGTMLTHVDSRALFGHLACGVIHDSERPAKRVEGPIVSATQTRLADVILALLQFGPASFPSSSTTSRLRALAQVFSEVGKLDVDDFRDFLTEIVVASRSQQLVHLELTILKGVPDYWRDAAQTYRDQLLSSIAKTEFFCPIEFSHSESLEAGFRATQGFLREFGELMHVWPKLWEQARKMGGTDLMT
jgi:hypothetical protein